VLRSLDHAAISVGDLAAATERYALRRETCAVPALLAEPAPCDLETRPFDTR
jgi:hypothetical protein